MYFLCRLIKNPIFLICTIVRIKRKAIFAKPFEKRISGGLFFKSAVNFVKKDLIFFVSSIRKNSGAVVQSVRISACHAEGRGFESRPHREKLQEIEAFFVFNHFSLYLLKLLQTLV
jgi:hypothetical protein